MDCGAGGGVLLVRLGSRRGIVGEVRTGGASKVSTFTLAWIKGVKISSRGGMWCVFNSLEKKIKKYPILFCSVLCYVSNVTFF
jgi:hypothetical protein